MTQIIFFHKGDRRSDALIILAVTGTCVFSKIHAGWSISHYAPSNFSDIKCFEPPVSCSLLLPKPTFSVYQLIDEEYQVKRFQGNDRIVSPSLSELNITAQQVFDAANVD
ncbi:MAG: hypothetical protein HC908_15360 [Calothrix sp. SM1_7_51]|nr:hypothetical protein [Calothrix sp. SM1_7_51]